MVYNTENTEWPSFKINSAVKNLISDFFLLLDNKDANVGDKLADDIFASKGEAKFGGHTFVGTDGKLLVVLPSTAANLLMMCQRFASQETMPGGQ